MNIFFGTDGWRAYLDSQINEESVAEVAQAFACFLKDSSNTLKVAVAYDTRRQSDRFAQIVAEVLSGNGITVLLSDRIAPTPILSFITLHYECSAGVMITASHNPPEYNGIKFKSCQGGPFSSEDTKKVESFLYTSPVVRSSGLISTINMLPEYMAHIEQLIDFKLISQANLPLLVDSMGGAGMLIIEQLLRSKNCPVHTICSEPSETFHGRLAEPIEKNLEPLMEVLKNRNYALGVATDGDADRVGVCTDNGQWLSAQNTILLLTDYLKRVKKVPGGIVKTSSVSDKIRCCFEAPDVPVYEVQVGFKYIADIMLREPIAFGGEESGGFGYGMHLPERDGIFSSLLLLEMLSASPYRKISDYLADRQKQTGIINYDRIDMHYDKADKNYLLPWLFLEQKLETDTFILENKLSFPSSRGIVNGLKFIFEGGCRWLLIRSSETENIIRIYAEGQTDEEVSRLLTLGKKLIFDTSTKNRVI